MKGSLPYLQILAKSKLKLRKILIENVPESVITAIYECCLNTRKGVIPLTPCQKRRLAPYKTYLRALANRNVSRKRKKNLFDAKGRKHINSSFTARSGRARKFVLEVVIDLHTNRQVHAPRVCRVDPTRHPRTKDANVRNKVRKRRLTLR